MVNQCAVRILLAGAALTHCLSRCDICMPWLRGFKTFTTTPAIAIACTFGQFLHGFYMYGASFGCISQRILAKSHSHHTTAGVSYAHALSHHRGHCPSVRKSIIPRSDEVHGPPEAWPGRSAALSSVRLPTQDYRGPQTIDSHLSAARRYHFFMSRPSCFPATPRRHDAFDPRLIFPACKLSGWY